MFFRMDILHGRDFHHGFWKLYEDELYQDKDTTIINIYTAQKLLSHRQNNIIKSISTTTIPS